MDEYIKFLGEIMSDKNKFILTMTDNDADFGKLVRYLENDQVKVFIDGKEVEDELLYNKIEEKYSIPEEFQNSCNKKSHINKMK